MSSSGEVVWLGILLAVAAVGSGHPRRRWLGAAGALLGATSAALRWGDGSMEAIAGAQSVLGAAVTVGPGVAATAAGLGALAVVAGVSVPQRAPSSQVLVGLAGGAAAAAVAWGPGPGDRLWQRVAATVLTVLVVLALAGARRVRGWLDRFLAAFAVVAGVASVACALAAPGSWELRLGDLASSFADGVAVAVAAAAIAVLVAALWHARAPMAQRRPTAAMGGGGGSVSMLERR